METSVAGVSVSVRDRAHLEAHRAEFFMPLEEVISIASRAVAGRARGRKGSASAAHPEEDRFFVRCRRPIGKCGLARLRPWTRGAYWAPRSGRAIPSHLIVGTPRPTRDLCVWGFWEREDRFLIHTLYPGRPAPREIHDPEIGADELDASISFWKDHAIIVERL